MFGESLSSDLGACAVVRSRLLGNETRKMRRIQKLKFYFTEKRHQSLDNWRRGEDSYNQPRDPSRINKFPEEILLKIFSYLSPKEISQRVMPVCQLWYRLAQDSRLWTELTFDSNKKNKYNSGQSSFQHVRSLVFRGYREPIYVRKVTDSIAEFNSKHLTELWLFSCFIPTEDLAKIGKTCPNIRVLALVKCKEDYTRAPFNRKYLKDCSFLSSYPNLKSLSVFRSIAIATFSYEDAQVICANCTRLKSLMLDCDFFGRGIRLILSTFHHQLEELWLQGRNYSDAICREISKCQKLRLLGMSRTENITAVGLQAIANLPNLEKLVLFRSNRIGISQFQGIIQEAGFKATLRYLNISEWQSFRDKEEEIYVIKTKMFRLFPRLKYFVADQKISIPTSVQGLSQSHWLVAMTPRLCDRGVWPPHYCNHRVLDE